jgi:hypothetical protein
MEHVLQRMRDAHDLVHRAGPYVLLEMLLPGGTLFALLLFLYRRHPTRFALAARAVGLGWVLGRMVDALDLRVVAPGAAAARDGLEPLGFGLER